MTPSTITEASALIDRAIRTRIFPAAVGELGSSADVLWRGAFGTRSFDDDSPAHPQTVFDLASLTKPVVTTSLALQLVGEGRCTLGDLVRDAFDDWHGVDREDVVLRDLLEHSSGLSPRLLDQPPEERRAFEHEICLMPLEAPPRSRAIYSDLGFILLGFLIEAKGQASLAAQFAEMRQRTFGAADESVLTCDIRGLTGYDLAPTLPLPEDHRSGRLLTGEVHDNSAAVLGGVAGHAGLFGNTEGLGRFARRVLRSARGETSAASPFTPELVGLATTKSRVHGSSRALGWDTMLPTSSCGTHLSPSSFGHVGHTGTSLWIDPEADRYYILLTNRACGGGTLDQMRDVRRAFHDTLSRL